MNTRMEFSVQKPDIDVKVGKLNIQVDSNMEPEIHFTPGKVHYTMEQYPKVTVTPLPIVDLMA